MPLFDVVELTGDCPLARPAQAFCGWGRAGFRWFSRREAACLLAVLALSGCGARGFSIEDAVPDRSIVTGSVSRQQPPAANDAVRTSDETTIGNAVSSAIVDEVGESGVGWANAATGSRGAISSILETKDRGYLCRRFTTSRESFDGVSLYSGETCLSPAKTWVMTSFSQID
jgi:hypothetical protein